MLRTRSRGSTIGFTTNFLAPGLGRDLVVDARIVKRGGTVCICEASVEDDGAAAVARALVTYRLSLPRPPRRRPMTRAVVSAAPAA